MKENRYERATRFAKKYRWTSMGTKEAVMTQLAVFVLMYMEANPTVDRKDDRVMLEAVDICTCLGLDNPMLNKE